MASLQALLQLQPIDEIIRRQEIPCAIESGSRNFHAYPSFKRVKAHTGNPILWSTFMDQSRSLYGEFESILGTNKFWTTQ
jgi:hypothetical protein